MLTFSIHAETPLQASPTYSKSTLRRTTGGNTYYLGPLPTDQHSQNNTRMSGNITLRSNSRNATRSVHDLLQPVASKKIPAGLTGKVAWTSYTYFIIRPMQFFHQQRIPGKLLSAERVHSTISSAVPGPYPEPLQTAARSREEEPQFGSRRREAPPYSGHTEVSREYHRRLHGAKLYPEAADREVLQFEASIYQTTPTPPTVVQPTTSMRKSHSNSLSLSTDPEDKWYIQSGGYSYNSREGQRAYSENSGQGQRAYCEHIEKGQGSYRENNLKRGP